MKNTTLIVAILFFATFGDTMSLNENFGHSSPTKPLTSIQDSIWNGEKLEVNINEIIPSLPIGPIPSFHDNIGKAEKIEDENVNDFALSLPIGPNMLTILLQDYPLCQFFQLRMKLRMVRT
jgi:hypothetical protein